MLISFEVLNDDQPAPDRTPHGGPDCHFKKCCKKYKKPGKRQCKSCPKR
ncbi:MAG: hypothetical protein WBA12_02005 [Catalinimonas sp.]